MKWVCAIIIAFIITADISSSSGLGKTCQVVAFFAHLLLTGEKGPHLVVVPASTLENWLREFKTFCPDLIVEPYYGSQKERAEIRQTLYRNPGFHVIVTTYNLATGDRFDRGFLKDMKFNVWHPTPYKSQSV